LNSGSFGAHDALQMEGPHEYPALGAPGVARGGVFRPRVPASLSAGGDRRPDERVTPALVSALYRRRRNIGGRGADAAGFHAHSAVARLLGGGWHHDRDDLRHDFSRLAW